MKIGIIVSTQVLIVKMYKVGVISYIFCIFCLVSISKLQLLLQFENFLILFSVEFLILNPDLNKNIL